MSICRHVCMYPSPLWGGCGVCGMYLGRYIYVCMYVCMYTFIHTYMYV